MAATSELPMIELRNGPLSLGLVPEIGGSIAFFRHDGIDLMRPLSPDAASRGDVLGVASFPMIPYANRIDGNQFSFEGETYRFQANNGAERFNVHGTGWHSTWTVAEHSGTSACLTLDHRDSGDPYRYRAIQTFSLSPEGLSIETSVENTGHRRMPFGFGHHPWFERDPDVTLKFRASHFWLEAPDGVAGDRITLPPELDFVKGAPLPQSWRNNCYSGWDGVAEVAFPSRGVRLRIVAEPLFRHLMFYADPTKPYFCVEPQTNASCAFNKTGNDLGVIVLGPEERSAAGLKLLVSTIGAAS